MMSTHHTCKLKSTDITFNGALPVSSCLLLTVNVDTTFAIHISSLAAASPWSLNSICEADLELWSNQTRHVFCFHCVELSRAPFSHDSLCFVLLLWNAMFLCTVISDGSYEMNQVNKDRPVLSECVSVPVIVTGSMYSLRTLISFLF